MPSSFRATRLRESSYDSLVPLNKSPMHWDPYPKQRYSTGRSYSPYILWNCDECGDSGMTGATMQCPQCQHHQCNFCKTYLKIGEETNRRKSPTMSHEDEASALSRKPRTTSKQIRASITAPPTIEGVEQSSNSVFNSHAVSEICLSSNASTPSLEPSLTPDSGSAFAASSSPFSYQTSMDNETDYETEELQDEADLTSDEDTAKHSDHWIWILESRLFSVLGHDLALAARLIPLIITQLQDDYASSDTAYTAYPSSENTGSTENYEKTSSVSTTPDQSIPSNRHHQVKRGHGNNEDDHEDNKRPKRQRGVIRHQNILRRPRFACHLHKSNPERYCAFAEVDLKFRVCLAPRATELRRLKDHYQKVHRPSQCERCYSIFEDRSGLCDHRKSEPPCKQQPDSYQVGINDSQWEKIEPLFKVKRGSSDSEKHHHDIENWFKIWRILFPNVSLPPHPWIDGAQIHPMIPSNDIEYVVNTFNMLIELDIEQDLLEPNIVRDQRCERALRLALQTYSAISGPIEEPSSGELDVDELESRSAETRSGLRATLECLLSEPTPQLLASDHSTAAPAPQDKDSMQLSIRTGDANIFSPTPDAAIASPQALYATPDGSFQVPNPSPLLFDQPSSLDPQILTIQGHPITSSGTSSGEIPIPDSTPSNYTSSPNPQAPPACLDIFDEADYPTASYFDSLQAGAMEDASAYFGFGDKELNSDSLTRLLEKETAESAVTAQWGNSRGGIRRLQGLRGQKPG